MVSVAASEGYAGATVAKVIAAAGVSRPTFYEYFADRDACVIASAQEVGGELRETVVSAVDASPECALGSALKAHVEFARNHPTQARFLLSETLAGGPRTLDERDRVIAGVAATIESAYERLDDGTRAPDVSSRIVIGGVWRLLAGRIRGDRVELDGFAEDLAGWIGRYSAPLSEHRWRTLGPVAGVSSSTSFAIEAPLRAPPTIAPGRTRMSREEVRENHRQRILAAITEAAKRKGYSATTIADITRIAGVDARTFNSLFSSKRDAFLTAHELGVQAVMAATAGAFFVEASWPERVWAAGLAFTGFLEANPLIAHMGFVEAYAVGAGAAKLLEDSRSAFTLFLQEGYQAYPQEHPPSNVALEAIAATAFELAYRLTREEVQHGMAGLLANIVHLALTPFMGAVEANRFIARKLGKSASSS
jgi:AcrR family transcriptional regulator